MNTTRRLFLPCAALLISAGISAQTRYANRIEIPDVGGYLTLQCDFHVHTVFSDGDVWPVLRVQEAAFEGLDAIALTDHVEYQPKGEYVSKDRNAAYRIAKQAAADAGVILIPGAEISRSMPPGHLNAIFVQDANALAKEGWKDAVAEAVNQGALIFYNHPGWESQQPDRVPKWYPEHAYLHDNGWLAGVEVVNSTEYYPDVLTWCLEKKIAVVGNSDTHSPIDMEFGHNPDRIRPLTLVFARERSVESIKEAIRERRTAVKRGGELIGEEEWLRRIFAGSVSFETKSVSLQGRGTRILRIANRSGVPYSLVLTVPDTNIQFPREIQLAAGRTALVPVRARMSTLSFDAPVTVTYEVTNLHVGARKVLTYPLTLQFSVRPKG